MPTGAVIRKATNAASNQRGSGLEIGQPLIGLCRMALEYAAFDTPGIYPSCCSRAWRATSNVVVALLKASHASFDRETAARPV